jgi:hypothetical protein
VVAVKQLATEASSTGFVLLAAAGRAKCATDPLALNGAHGDE